MTSQDSTQAGGFVEIGSKPVNDACWAFVDAMPHQLPGPIWNGLKPAIYAALKVYHEQVLTTHASQQAAVVSGLEKDAARYRWLREKVGVEQTNGGTGPTSVYLYSLKVALESCKTETDAAIDHAMKEQP